MSEPKKKPPIKTYRGIRLDRDLDAAIPILLERLAEENGRKTDTVSSFIRKATRFYYNREVHAYNQRMKDRASNAL